MEPGILVGVDGSTSANAAVRWAARDAAMRHTTLTLVHAAAPVMGTWFATPVPTGVLERQHELGRQILDVATKIAKESTHGSLPISTELLSTATVPALVRMSSDAQLAVVGCQGRGAVGRTLLGSISMGLVHRAQPK